MGAATALQGRLRPATLPLRGAVAPLLIAGGAAVGWSVSPLLAVAGAVLLAFGTLTLLSPVVATQLTVASLAIGFGRIDAFGGQADLLNRAQKLALLVVLVSALLQLGVRHRVAALPACAYTVVAIMTFTVATREAGMSLSNTLLSFLTLNLGWLALAVRWPERAVLHLLRVVALVPLISVVAGGLLQLAGQASVTHVEYTGVLRLQGATTPAGLGLLATGATMAALVLWSSGRRREGGALWVLNVLIAAMTGTRGAVIAIVVITAVPLVQLVRAPRRSDARLVRGVALAVLVGAALAVYAPVVLARSESSSSEGLDTSGRGTAWSYFYHRVDVNPDFGLGLGSAPLLAKDTSSLSGDFTAQHNEYLRAYVEGGRVGVVLVIGAIGALLVLIARRAERSMRGLATAVVIAFAVYSITDNTLSDFLLFVPFGLVLNALTAPPRTQP